MLIESVRSEENEIGDPGALPKRARRTTCSGQAGRPGNGRVSERGRRSGDVVIEPGVAVHHDVDASAVLGRDMAGQAVEMLLPIGEA